MRIAPRDVPPRSCWQLEQAGIHPLLARLYAARGITQAAELDGSLTHLLPSATLLGAEQAARILGMKEAAVFFRITLPLAWRGIMAGLLLAFARALGEFGATLMVAGSIPGKTQTLSIAIYEAVQAGQDDTANLLVLITSIVCVAVLLSAGKLALGRIAHR